MKKNWITLIVFSIVTVAIWILMEVLFVFLHKDEVEQDYTYYLTPITPGLNEESLEMLKEREEEYIMIEPGGLE
jgi:hypothetical protein